MVRLKYKEGMDVWQKIKAWWAKVKLWFSKNKKIIIGIGTAFIAGFIAALRINSRGNADIKRHIAELKEQLRICNELNTKLQELGAELSKRTESIAFTSEELQHQHDIIAELGSEAESTIGRARNELTTIEQGLTNVDGNVSGLSEANGKLSIVEGRLGDSIQRLADFIAKYET